MKMTNPRDHNLQVSKVVLAEPRGFCAGVNRAIDIVDRALEFYGAPIYVRHEIVHNHHVVNDFKNRGVIFVEDLDQVPDNVPVIFSAHGTAPEIIRAAEARGLKFIDAVCPLVTKVHKEITKAIGQSKKVIYIGHRGHQEVLGAMGYSQTALDQGTVATASKQFDIEQDIYLIETPAQVDTLKQIIGDQEVVVATQTTLSLDDTQAIVDKLKQSFSKLELPDSDDICYATQNRQDAVKELVKHCDQILIIGSENSSNTLRLLELAKKLSKPARLVPDPQNFELTKDLDGKVIGISSGASAPEFLVDELIYKLGAKDRVEVLRYKQELITFPLPKELVVK